MACTLGYLHRQRIRMRAMGHEARHADAGKAALPKEHLSGARAHTPGGLSVMMTALPGPLGTPPKPYRVVVSWAFAAPQAASRTVVTLMLITVQM